MAEALPAAMTDVAADRLARLFDRHYERLYRLARRLAPSADAARDLVQDAFLRAARSPNAIPHGARDEEAWLVRVLVNLQRDAWRKSAVRSRYAGSPHHVSTIGSVESAVVARATVWRALDALAPRRRAVVVLHELEGLDVRAIASLLGISGVTVRWHLSRGRRELAVRLGALKKE
ncbi:MAG TPA: RNA polymerase sigma factor [Vicinamibacterales bacterium]|nr:RNA polymerase sigma factor [Vicinamibacterales bacterium]